jgi:hypothetical protein
MKTLKDKALRLAEQNQQTAWKILEDTRIIEAWESIGATVHIIGSLKSGLLMKSRNIDFHIYTENPLINGSNWLP